MSISPSTLIALQKAGESLHAARQAFAQEVQSNAGRVVGIVASEPFSSGALLDTGILALQPSLYCGRALLISSLDGFCGVKPQRVRYFPVLRVCSFTPNSCSINWLTAARLLAAVPGVDLGIVGLDPLRATGAAVEALAVTLFQAQPDGQVGRAVESRSKLSRASRSKLSH